MSSEPQELTPVVGIDGKDAEEGPEKLPAVHVQGQEHLQEPMKSPAAKQCTLCGLEVGKGVSLPPASSGIIGVVATLCSIHSAHAGELQVKTMRMGCLSRHVLRLLLIWFLPAFPSVILWPH
jgi:hypothetical protein